MGHKKKTGSKFRSKAHGGLNEVNTFDEDELFNEIREKGLKKEGLNPETPPGIKTGNTKENKI